MSAPERPWVGQYQAEWEIKSADPRLPKWLRVAALAYGRHGANGHAQFAAGDLALIFATVDPATGEIKPDRHVKDHVNLAVSLNWLSQSSGARCLVVPGHSFRSAPGSATAPCTWHHRSGRRT